MTKSTVRFILVCALAILAGCNPRPAGVPSIPSPTPNTNGFSETEFATLNSLEQLDEYPLYTMHYFGAYPTEPTSFKDIRQFVGMPAPSPSVACRVNWGCSLFAALGDDKSRLYGRNFDWQYSPALLLFTDPPDGYASVSMVDIEYLDFSGESAKNLADSPIDQRRRLLDAPFLPFDGMNEKGLAIGMAAVPAGNMQADPQKGTIDQLMVIREILDHAATVDEAITILGSYNIDMGEVPIHYLVASASGESALVEFYQGEMVVFRNESPWQEATNFLVASMNGSPEGACWRYDRIHARLGQTNGRINVQDALRLLSNVSQDITQWSVVYDMTGGSIHIVMGGEYGTVHTLNLR